MTRQFLTLLALAMLSSGITASPAWAQRDQGKRRLNKLFAEAISGIVPSTVRIQCNDRDAALGTIVSTDGLILTKGSELRGEITVLLSDGTSYTAKYIGYHRESDLALLKIDADGLKPIEFPTKDAAEVGNWVAVTSLKEDPLAVGVISAGARKLYFDEAIIQNSNKGMLGIQMRLDDDTGIVISSVLADSAASRAGLKENDVILNVAGKDVTTRQQLQELLDNYKPGDTVTVRVKRGEEELSLKVRLGSRSDADRSAFQNQMGGQLSGRRTGFPMVIQHDTVISPTDCGGPLVDLDGRVLGINIARAGRVETWTLPVTVINPILKDLKAGKYPLPQSLPTK